MNYNPKPYIPYEEDIHKTLDDEIYVFSTSRANFGLILEYKTDGLMERYNKNFFDALCYFPSEIEFFCKALNESKNTPIFTVGGKKHRLIIAFHIISAPICVAVVLSSPVEYACKSAVEFF